MVLMEEASKMEPVIRKQLGIGCGCSMEDDETTAVERYLFDKLSHAKMFGEPTPR